MTYITSKDPKMPISPHSIFMPLIIPANTVSVLTPALAIWGNDGGDVQVYSRSTSISVSTDTRIGHLGGPRRRCPSVLQVYKYLISTDTRVGTYPKYAMIIMVERSRATLTVEIEIKAEEYKLYKEEEGGNNEEDSDPQEATLDRSNVYRWYKMFSEGREDVNDEERAGRQSTSTTDEKINEVEKIILANRRITVREVAEDLNISIGSCHSIL
ncbi:hypothetical protein LAZ67_4003661 [Cordylochernes scorpioides]|uniref:Uncharacterized protein n=1 Tax=Cordylochernes scorpioides TaxID=51811 RepID=A0ABY6KEY8_9ARAC|nr:hypothetical protein LAZ67_4003661 [Cordylochernes scorpioides]